MGGEGRARAQPLFAFCCSRKRSNFLTSAGETDLRIFAIALSKWALAILSHTVAASDVVSEMCWRIASLHARWHTSVMSAPEQPSVELSERPKLDLSRFAPAAAAGKSE